MNASEEREQSVRRRFPREAAATFGPSAWRANGVLVQIVFFILTCLAMGAAYLFIQVFSMPLAGVVIGVASIVVAEVLIRRGKWFGTGVEAALWFGGLFAMITELPSSGSDESLLVLGSAAAIAGARVRNPVFGAVAAGFAIQYAENKLDLGVIAALAVALFAGLMLLREWQRPSTEWLWIALVLVAPIVGRVHADVQWRPVTIASYATFGLLMFTLAVLRRHHALFAAGAIALGIALVDVAERIPLPVELRLATSGLFLLGGSLLLSRLLRDQRRGIVTMSEEPTALDAAVEMLGTVAAAHASHVEGAPEAKPSGGGEFGGAGASGSF
jgi:hypothetical protein